MERNHTLLSLQYLRGLAALAVVAMHTGWTRTSLGAAGVDVFFVISGFVMVMAGGRSQTPWAFLRARALRIVPLYWVATSATILVTGLDDVPRILTSFAFWPHLGFDGGDYPVVIQGWTLNYEVFFYVAFGASLVLAERRRLAALTAALLALVALGRCLPPSGIAVTTYTGPLLVEFLAGAWLCRAWQGGKLPSGRGAVALLAIGFAMFAAQFSVGTSGNWRCLTWGIPALLVVAGTVGLEGGGRVPLLPRLRALGDASYALYLTHLLVRHQLLAVLSPLPLPLALPLMLAASVAVAFVVHYGIEAPLGTLLRRPRNALAAGRPQDVTRAAG